MPDEQIDKRKLIEVENHSCFVGLPNISCAFRGQPECVSKFREYFGHSCVAGPQTIALTEADYLVYLTRKLTK